MLQIIIDSLVRSSQLALLAVGLTLIYDLLRFASFLHVQFGTIGAYLTLTLSLLLPIPKGWAVLISAGLAIVIVGYIGIISDRLVFSKLRNRSAVILMVASFGMGIIFQFGTQAIWGASAKSYPLPLERPWILWDARLTASATWLIISAVVAMVCFHIILKHTKLGVAMRATADNPQLSEASGIFTERIIRIVWFLGAAMGALGGIMLALVTQLNPNMGFEIMLPVFAAAILGGIGNPYGAVLGACVVGFAENVGLAINWGPLGNLIGMGSEYAYIPVGFKAAIPFVILILMLLVRPQGLLGGKSK